MTFKLAKPGAELAEQIDAPEAQAEFFEKAAADEPDVRIFEAAADLRVRLGLN